jgi:feruloyl esterase
MNDTLIRISFVVGAAILLHGCTTDRAGKAVDPAQACAALTRPIDEQLIGLPSGGATIESAMLVAPAPLSLNPKPLFSPPPPDFAVIPATPEYCKVVGAIAPVDPKAPPIRFQVNLPTQWNGRSFQYGGAGFNGVLITGLGLPAAARPDLPSPLMRGYVTYGTDSGHQNAPGVPLHAFALSDEALTNFAYASYKKVRDVAVELMKRRYGSPPKYVYFFGYSEGGREGLTMAQRFPSDYDGIFSRVPVINWTGLLTASAHMGAVQMRPGAWLDPEAVKVVHDAVLAACDARDGLADGIVSDYEGCARAFDASKLPRCAPGQHAGCLSDAQVRAVETLYSPYTFSFPLANGVTQYPAWGRGGEALRGTGPVGGWTSWLAGTAPPTLQPGPTAGRGWLYGSGVVQYFITRNPKFDVSRYEPAAFAERVRQVSALMDSTNPDLSAFAGRGGKLVIAENTADYAQSPFAGIEYYRSVVARMGQATADKFLRLYIAPGVDHMGMGAPSNVDMLQVIADWVEQGRAPGELVQVAQQPGPPFEVVMTRPMCRYPRYPYYLGGDSRRAESFQCRGG